MFHHNYQRLITPVLLVLLLPLHRSVPWDSHILLHWSGLPSMMLFLLLLLMVSVLLHFLHLLLLLYTKEDLFLLLSVPRLSGQHNSLLVMLRSVLLVLLSLLHRSVPWGSHILLHWSGLP